MADYYPLISRALDGLTDKSLIMRRAVYDRARTALVDQLQSLDPPLPAAEITRERLALDEAIDRIEAEYALGEASLESGAESDLGRALPEAGPAGRIRSEPIRDPFAERDPNGLALEEPAEAARERPRVAIAPRKSPERGRGRAVILGAVLAVVVGLIAATAWYLNKVRQSEPLESPVAEAPKAPERDNTKLSDRVTGERPAPGAAPGQGQGQGQGTAQAPPAVTAPRPDVPVAQRAILYEENQADPQNPKASPGRALWRLDALNPGQGQTLETVVRASVEVSAANLSVALSIRRNTDSTLPASHIVELTFTTPPDDPSRMVRDVGLLQFKAEEAVRGTPLAGLPVPVKDNVFLIGLSNLPGDMERNRELMLRRNWIDLPIRFASGQRAILSFEKGVSGDQVINDAFRQWGS